MSNKEHYDNIALQYAEKYGIITYRVKGKCMIYNRNSNDKEFLGGKWVSKPTTYQRTVDLDTMQVTVKKLARLQKDGWDNT